jgi:hypothetical protein
MQTAQLHHQQKQKEADRQILDQEVLSELPGAYRASRMQGLT